MSDEKLPPPFTPYGVCKSLHDGHVHESVLTMERVDGPQPHHRIVFHKRFIVNQLCWPDGALERLPPLRRIDTLVTGVTGQSFVPAIRLVSPTRASLVFSAEAGDVLTVTTDPHVPAPFTLLAFTLLGLA